MPSPFCLFRYFLYLLSHIRICCTVLSGGHGHGKARFRSIFPAARNPFHPWPATAVTTAVSPDSKAPSFLWDIPACNPSAVPDQYAGLPAHPGWKAQGFSPGIPSQSSMSFRSDG